MARKFQVGDTVEVVKNLDNTLDNTFKIGHRGKVMDYMNGQNYPYEVKRKNGNECCFNVRELKLIKRKGTK